MNRLFPIAGLLLALAGCASTPSVHYTLTPAANSVNHQGNQQSSQAAVKASAIKPYALTRVTVPVESDQTALVVRQEDGRMLVLELDRWVSTLSTHLQSALSVDMTAQLGMPPVQNLGTAAMDKSVTRIQVDLQRFDMVPGRQVSMSAVWRMQFASPLATIICHAELLQAVDPGVSSMVLGQQKNVRQLSTLISQTLVARGTVTGAKCSTL